MYAIELRSAKALQPWMAVVSSTSIKDKVHFIFDMRSVIKCQPPTSPVQSVPQVPALQDGSASEAEPECAVVTPARSHLEASSGASSFGSGASSASPHQLLQDPSRAGRLAVDLLEVMQIENDFDSGGDSSGASGSAVRAAKAERAPWDQVAERVDAQNQRLSLATGEPNKKVAEAHKFNDKFTFEVTYPKEFTSTRNLMGMFAWPQHMYKAIDASDGLNNALVQPNVDDDLDSCVYRGMPAAMTRFIHNMTYTSVGLGWAGVDAPGTAINMMSCQLLTYLKDVKGTSYVPPQRDNMFHPIMKYAVEDFWKPEIKATINRMKQQGKQVDLNSLLPLILSDRSVKLKAECYRCGGGKQCVLECCDVHVAGVSRKAFSKFGKREGVESTEHMSAMAAWAATVRATKPKVVIFENSDRFREEILHSLFKDMYAIEGLKLGGPYFGWAGKRDRYCAVMVNKEFVTGVVFSMRNVLPLFHRALETTFMEFLVGHKDRRLGKQLEEELNWAAGRPTSRASKYQNVTELKEKAKYPYYDALTFGEIKFLDQYEVKGGLEKRCAMLNQSEDRGYGIKSSEDGILHPLVRNPAIHFVVDTENNIKRWLSGYEMLVCQGFPVLNELANPGGELTRACSFGRCLEDNDLPTRFRSTMVKQAGNTMQVPVVGAVLAYVYLCVRFGDKMPPQVSIPGDLSQELARPFAEDPFDTLGEIFMARTKRSRSS
ncbi:unnamed protein product [Prorocentrum cordatum]|uniref:Uncharacterized protein n=1 Tax=Prorocentrum cordatum TaxID=2364126 RepID=A0ABN9PLF3_9DINO|nr:unnamed protein product [Polarella glacialis]